MTGGLPSSAGAFPSRPYAPRAVRGLGVHSIGGWRVKLYGLYAIGDVASPAALDGALRTARDVLPPPTAGSGGSGGGFVIAHHGAEAFFYVVGWWSFEGTLMTASYQAPLDDPIAPRPCAGTTTARVWELGIVDHERRAWIDAMMRADGAPDLDTYLSRFVTGTI